MAKTIISVVTESYDVTIFTSWKDLEEFLFGLNHFYFDLYSKERISNFKVIKETLLINKTLYLKDDYENSDWLYKIRKH